MQTGSTREVTAKFSRLHVYKNAFSNFNKSLRVMTLNTSIMCYINRAIYSTGSTI